MKQLTIGLIILLCSCSSNPRDNPDVKPAVALQIVIEETMAEAREAVDRYGETDAAMKRIETALSKLSRQPGLKERADDLNKLHDSSSMMAKVLASEGENGITLFIIRFASDSSTPVHDHLTWGVIHILEGRDRYTQWKRMDDGTTNDRAELQIKFEKTLEPGQSVYWLPPPNDIHNQESLDSDVWELVLSGKNLTAEGVTHHRHYYDPKTGRVTKAKAY